MTPKRFPALEDTNPKIALVEQGRECSYGELNRAIDRLACGLLRGRDDLRDERIAIFMPAGIDYVTGLFGVWRAGGVAVPLNVAAAVPELEHCLTSAGVSRLVFGDACPQALQDLCDRHGILHGSVAELVCGRSAALPTLDDDRRAMMLFTSGTTSKPKGVVSTHKAIRAQVTTLVDAWRWTPDDVIPLFLPLHHIHGIVNVLCCGLWAGATIDLFDGFDAATLGERVMAGRFTLFMAVPTVYRKLIGYLETSEPERTRGILSGFGAMRLNVSGSAACPVSLFEKWQELCGQVLLERYGMTEIGMAISNPYAGERRAGTVGQPLPGVAVRLFDEHDRVIDEEGRAGEIRVQGDNVFREYWNNPAATEASFRDGWFCTGDVAVVEDGYYRIMGRSSIDIIKSGGYKLSALEIEGALLNHEAIDEVAVIGVDDETWGEAVAAFVVLKRGYGLSYEDLKAWCGARMSAYKIPKRLVIVESLPRNAMGKVTKPALSAMLSPD